MLRISLCAALGVVGCSCPEREPPVMARPSGGAHPVGTAPTTAAPGTAPAESSGPLAGISIVGHSYYRRTVYGDGWIDADEDCQSTRDEVLVAESLVPVEFRPRDDGQRCKVVHGLWHDPFTLDGKADPRSAGNGTDTAAAGSRGFFTDPGDLDVDHFVPLANVHACGGDAWTAEQRRAYANDLAFPKTLRAIDRSQNRSKGDKDPSRWMPPNRESWCEYLEDWRDVKRRYRLSMRGAERRAFLAYYAEAGCTFP